MIVCCREDEGSSLLVSDLRDYKRSSYPLRENAEIRDYLRKHFIEDADVACQDVGGCVGASVDPERYIYLQLPGICCRFGCCALQRLIDLTTWCFSAPVSGLLHPQELEWESHSMSIV